MEFFASHEIFCWSKVEVALHFLNSRPLPKFELHYLMSHKTDKDKIWICMKDVKDGAV